MRVLFAAAAALCLGLSAPAAMADCVNFSQSRANAAAAALSRNPPTAAQLGLPSLEGLTLDAARTAGDPQCSGPPPYSRYIYTTTMSFTDVVTAYYPHIRRRTTTDGMNREWFGNPFHSDSFFLTSGTELDFNVNTNTGVITQVLITPTRPAGALTPETQPYAIADIASGTPWPGGADGPRQFVRADGGDAGYQAPNNNNYRGGSTTTTTPAAGQQTAQQGACPPPSGNAASGAHTGGSVGADVGGAVIGGGYGRNVGRTAGAILGGALGGRRAPAQQPSQPQNPNCP